MWSLSRWQFSSIIHRMVLTYVWWYDILYGERVLCLQVSGVVTVPLERWDLSASLGLLCHLYLWGVWGLRVCLSVIYERTAFLLRTVGFGRSCDCAGSLVDSVSSSFFSFLCVCVWHNWVHGYFCGKKTVEGIYATWWDSWHLSLNRVRRGCVRGSFRTDY